MVVGTGDRGCCEGVPWLANERKQRVASGDANQRDNQRRPAGLSRQAPNRASPLPQEHLVGSHTERQMNIGREYAGLVSVAEKCRRVQGSPREAVAFNRRCLHLLHWTDHLQSRIGCRRPGGIEPSLAP
jgi:hypothetical protein